MPHINTITAVHVKKLEHNIDEIRSRALNNIISKLNLGFGCDSDVVKRELIIKLLNWFSFDSIPQPEAVIDLLIRLLKSSKENYSTVFSKTKLQNDLGILRKKLHPMWHNKLNEIEKIIYNSKECNGLEANTQYSKDALDLPLDYRPSRVVQNHINPRLEFHDPESNDYDIGNLSSPLDSTVFDLTIPSGDGTLVSKSSESGIRWLAMPWQPLVTSDKGVLNAVEEALNCATDTNLIVHTCQFITNVMLQDFPAEVFLQRPDIILVLHRLLALSDKMIESNAKDIISSVLKTLQKLTRSLRFRIYYYCDPCIANKKQKLLGEKMDYNDSPAIRDSPDGGLPEANYQAYQSTNNSERSQFIIDNIDDSVLQSQQMLIPTYCIESLKYVVSQLSTPIDESMPLKNTKYITDLIHELVQLLIISIMPNIWIANDEMAYKFSKDLKQFFILLGEVLDYFGNHNSIDHFRITYLHLLCISIKLLSQLVPLELADAILPKVLKVAITQVLMDAPIYLLYPTLHSTIQEYVRQFKNTDEIATVKLFDETRLIAKSIQLAISSIKNIPEQSYSEILKKLYASKLSLSYHKNFVVVKQIVKFLQNMHRYSLDTEDYKMATKLILYLLANGDNSVQHFTYVECHALVKNILGVEYSKEKLTWENISFLLEPSIFIQIISHGLINEDDRIKNMGEDILVYILKGRIQMGEIGWSKTLEGIIPVMPLLQCYADPSTNLGSCVTKMLDPDVFEETQLPYIEVLKGNIRLLYADNYDIREEAICRVIWLLGREKNSNKKLPRLSSLHGLPLNSLCIFDRQKFFKQPEGHYQKSNLLSVLEMLNESNIDPKIRKSALVQLSVMLSDMSLHKLFINENGLSMILKSLNSSLIEKEYTNYPDSVIPIITILKHLSLTEFSVRQELTTQIDILLNIIRSLFLFPNNECVKTDGSQLLCILLYSEFIMRTNDPTLSDQNSVNISLPYIVTLKMRLPFLCKSHWKSSIHRKSDVTVLHGSNQTALTFIRQYWAWEWNGGFDMLWKHWNDLNDPNISNKLMIQETEFLLLRYSSCHYYCQQQLYTIQNSTTHDGVIRALDYIIMYLKMYKMLIREEMKDISLLSWEHTFEKFLISHPTNLEDCDLFVHILNFLQIYMNIAKQGTNEWISKLMKNMTKSSANLFQNLEMTNQDVHQSILKLVRTYLAMEKDKVSKDNSKDTWICFIEFLVSNLSCGDQQHFYNLAYLDWLLTCLTYLIGECNWENHHNLLIFLGNTLIELIISFHGAGSVSFMGLSITRNAIICLNHLLYQMQINFNKNAWTLFWYKDDRSLSWLPMLWQNRDPLVRASALQLLAGLTNSSHSAPQLLNSITMAPTELCLTLLQCITTREESCIVREQACNAFSNIVKSCGSLTFQYVDLLKPNAILIYIEQSNLYHEISILCSNIYMLATLDSDTVDSPQQDESGKARSIKSVTSACNSMVPRAIFYLYSCYDELPLSKSSGITDEIDSYAISTPSLITAACTLLNNLILVGQQEVIRQIYEYSVDKHLLRCLNDIPKDTKYKKSLIHYCDTLEMYISICMVLTNCIIHSTEFAAVASFTQDSLYTLFNFFDNESYYIHTTRLIYLRNKLWTEVYNFIAVLSLTNGQHFETIQTTLELHCPEKILTSILIAIKHSVIDLRMSAIGCLVFLLSLEIQKETLGKSNISLKTILDSNQVRTSGNNNDNELHEIISSINKLAIKSANVHSKKSKENEQEEINAVDVYDHEKKNTIGTELCKALLHLFIAHNHTRSKKNRKQMEDKDLICGALSNLLCVSQEAKKVALTENLCETILMVLKEIYVKLNIQPYEMYKNLSERDKKVHPLLCDIDCISTLLMNFMYDNLQVKEALAQAGLSDVIHKIWVWIALNENLAVTVLKLLATFTTKCSIAAKSLTFTTTLPGIAIRRTPNTVSLIHVLIHLIGKEIDKAGSILNNHKLHSAFHILRNAVHVHECRVCISKSNILHFLPKIHPNTTKRVKPWPIIEIYCLEFLIDFTFYEEGQSSVSKATDALEVLILLGKCSTTSTRILAISILRNLAFNVNNRIRLLTSVDFLNFLHDVFKNGSLCEIEIVGPMLWSLICNHQKGKLIARNAGFTQSIQEALGRITLLTIGDTKHDQEVVKTLQYVISILSPLDSKTEL